MRTLREDPTRTPMWTLFWLCGPGSWPRRGRYGCGTACTARVALQSNVLRPFRLTNGANAAQVDGRPQQSTRGFCGGLMIQRPGARGGRVGVAAQGHAHRRVCPFRPGQAVPTLWVRVVRLHVSLHRCRDAGNARREARGAPSPRPWS